ncbi:molybdenum cofactor guanylyltransferase [Sporosarcina sp. BI001-red]|uniref:molybdenum cofactor guanylyltransferase n=1 Tax=Sporosarcina sp. BI001-red TaxID=2282866 RepID=UPI001314F692|nr:molybdenum cofactor guanylyltransferase [Sporosarcina sp. BI001-red]
MIGIVLAGGQSRRFGSTKAFAMYNGKCFYEYAITALAPHCSQIVVVARKEDVNRFPSTLHIVTDLQEFAGQGPLAGILTGMNTIQSDWYAVLPCDVPFADDSIIRKLMNHRTGNLSVAIEEIGKCHPLLSIWSKGAEPMIRSSLEMENRSVRPLIHHWVDGQVLLEKKPSLFDNVNKPGQLEGR